MVNNNFIGVYPNAFSSEFCDTLIKVFEKNNDVGTELKNIEINNDTVRTDKAIWLDQVSPLDRRDLMGEFNDVLTSYLITFAEEYPILKTMEFASFEIKLQRTEIGGGYHQWHCEQYAHDVASRMLVWSVYLNDIEEGGETEFLYQAKRIKATKGTVVLFPASWTHTHRGNPPLSNKKYIATGWYNLK